MKIGIDGEVLVIHNISRDFDDLYECLVDNGVPPALTKSTRVIVEFPPEVVVERPRVGQFIGRKTVLECSVYAYPQYLVVWKRRGKQITSNKKYTVEVDSNAESRLVTLRLIIHRVSRRNYGKYTCEAKNDLGQGSSDAVLYEIEAPRTTSTTTTTQATPATASEKNARVLKNTEHFVSHEQPGLHLQVNKPGRSNSSAANSIPTKPYSEKHDPGVGGPRKAKPVFGGDFNRRRSSSTRLLAASLLIVTLVFAQFLFL
ncbi:lachesin-like [Gigantopelta aegis]|uniref:lachesin-like n=1 Tax=Gigantopelta aegis TaxID=1735272 RepID=UPI001B888E56|nr:lachesin-like [Gigantopelta aegis]